MQGKKGNSIEVDMAESAGEAVDLLKEKLYDWTENLIVMLPNFVVAVLVVIAFVLLGKIIKNVVSKILKKFSRHPALDSLFTGLTFITIVIIGLFIALGVLNLDKTVTSLLAGAGIIGLVLGFAFQDVAANFMAGIIIILKKPFLIGDIIESSDHFGTVEQTSFRTTMIRTPEGQIVYLPNKGIFQNPLINYTKIGKRRIDLKVGISYGEDLENVREVTVSAVEKINYRDKERPLEFFYEEFGDSSINFVVRFWVDFSKQPDYLRGRSDAIMHIKKAYNENGITIPFPIRTLDFGIKGGKTLSEMDVSVNNKRNINK